MKSIYLDYAAATPVNSRVLKAMLPFLKDDFSNPSSIHAGGVKAHQAVDKARLQVAKLIGARSNEIIFTSGATESINLAILGAARAHAHIGKHIVSVTTEHKASLKALEQEGFDVTLVPVDQRGQVNAQAVLEAVRPDTVLVSVMLANNEIGTLAPIADIGRALQRRKRLPPSDGGIRGGLFHTDAAQAAGVVALDVEKLHVDLMTFSAAKMYGPKGIGALYVRTGTKMNSIMFGGNHEFGVRPGTENVPGIIGFGAAAKIAITELDANGRHLWEVREAFVATLSKHCKTARINGDPEATVPHIVNVTFSPNAAPPLGKRGLGGVASTASGHAIDGEELVLRLDAAGIACSTAAACQSSDFPSTVLRAIGLSDTELKSTVRFSFGRSTTVAQVKKAAKVIAKNVDQLS